MNYLEENYFIRIGLILVSIYSWFWTSILWGRKINSGSFKFVELCFIAQHMHYLWDFNVGFRLYSVTVRYGAPRCNIENFTVFRICITCFTLSVGFSKMGLEQCLRSVFLLYRKCDYPTLCKNGEDWDLGSVQGSLPWSFIDAAEDVECVDQDKGLWFLPQGKTCALCW